MSDKAISGINAMTQFLAGYLSTKQEMEEKAKKEKQRKQIEEKINQGNYIVEYGSDGTYKLKQISPADQALMAQRLTQANLRESELAQRQAIEEKIAQRVPLSPEEKKFYYGYQPNVYGFMGELDFPPAPSRPQAERMPMEGGGIREDTVIENPTTGERRILRGGEWQKL